ncbi:MAG: T9SS type A sorting domain-containing protein [Rhodothermaceae bacterium]|nr:T9SS type A sorting domain-containing protein [Rhodothermaceae bacterium]
MPRLVRSAVASRSLLPLLVLGATLATAPRAQAQGVLDVEVCLRDEMTNQPLDEALVRAAEGNGPTAEATTGTNGCAMLSVTTVATESTVPESFRVGPVYPNPFTERAQVNLTLDQTQSVTWHLYDLVGRRVRGPVTTTLLPGPHRLDFTLDDLAAGRYFLQITGAEHTVTQPLIKATTGVARTTAGVAAPLSASAQAGTLLTFTITRVGYDPILTEQEVGDQATVTFTMAAASTTARPLTDMEPGESYLGFEGGLYPNWSNTAPPSHHAEGLTRGQSIEPLDANGNPSPNGRIVMLSIGMSNVTQEFCHVGSDPSLGCDPWTFMGQAEDDPTLNTLDNGGSLVIVNGARGGQASEEWDDPASSQYDRIEQEVFPYHGVTAEQVQVVWHKAALSTLYFGSNANRSSLPDADADAYATEIVLGDLVRALRVRYPNLKQVFVSSRIYGGYASPMSANPEPFAHEGGFGTKWMIEAQITQRSGGPVDAEAGDLAESVAPWVAWGPYLWAPGEDDSTPRSDGLVWLEAYFQGDGVHPNPQGEEIVADHLMDFFTTSPYTRCWFVTGGSCSD